MDGKINKKESPMPQPNMAQPNIPPVQEPIAPQPQVKTYIEPPMEDMQQPVPPIKEFQQSIPPLKKPEQFQYEEVQIPEEQIPQRMIISADGQVVEDSDITNFEYLAKKVAVLQEQVELMQKILEQNNLSFKIEARANINIENKTWQLLTAGEM